MSTSKISTVSGDIFDVSLPTSPSFHRSIGMPKYWAGLGRVHAKVMTEKIEIQTDSNAGSYEPKCQRRPDSRIVVGDGGRFLDALSVYMRVANDAELCRQLEVLPSLISKIRHGRGVGVLLLIRIHEVTGLPISRLRASIEDEEALAAE